MITLWADINRRNSFDWSLFILIRHCDLHNALAVSVYGIQVIEIEIITQNKTIFIGKEIANFFTGL